MYQSLLQRSCLITFAFRDAAITASVTRLHTPGVPVEGPWACITSHEAGRPLHVSIAVQISSLMLGQAYQINLWQCQSSILEKAGAPKGFLRNPGSSHYSDTLGMYRTQVSIFHLSHYVCLGGLLKGQDAIDGPAKVRLDTRRNFAHQALEGGFLY